MDNVKIHAVSRELVVLMPTAVSQITENNVFVLKTSQETQRLSVSEYQAPASVPQTALNLFSAVMVYVCQAVLQMKAVPSMKDVSKDFACVSRIKCKCGNINSINIHF